MINFSAVIPVFPPATLQYAAADWNKNRLDNGNFDVWQSGNGFTINPVGGAYVADRWQVFNLTGASAAVNKVAAPRGFFGISAIALQVSGAPAGGGPISLAQKFRAQAIMDLDSDACALSFDCRATTSAGTLYGYIQIFTNATQDDGTFVLPSPQQAFAIPASAGRVRVALSPAMTVGLKFGGYVSIAFQQIGAAGNLSATVGAIQFEQGGVANGFSVRPPAVEMLACTREYFVGPKIRYGATSASAARNHCFVPLARMAAIPTVTVLSGVTNTANMVADVTGAADVACSISTPTVDGFDLYLSGAPSANGVVLSFAYTADCRL